MFSIFRVENRPCQKLFGAFAFEDFCGLSLQAAERILFDTLPLHGNYSVNYADSV